METKDLGRSSYKNVIEELDKDTIVNFKSFQVVSGLTSIFLRTSNKAYVDVREYKVNGLEKRFIDLN